MSFNISVSFVNSPSRIVNTFERQLENLLISNFKGTFKFVIIKLIELTSIFLSYNDLNNGKL